MSGKYKIKKLQGVLNPENCIFICCASYEDRCKSIPSQLNNNHVKKAFICEHEEVIEFVAQNAKQLHSYFNSKSERVLLSLSDPLKTADCFIDIIEEIFSKPGQSVLIDITTFTHESLLILLSLLQSQFESNTNHCTVRLLYSPASDYSTKQNKPDKWLSRGIRNVRSILGSPGFLLPSRKLHLIVLSSLEEERASRLIECFEAAFISVGVGRGDDLTNPNLIDLNNSFHERLCNLYQNVETFSFSLTNPLETKKDLKKQIAVHPNCNIVVAPLNNKLSTVGTALLAFENTDVQLCYAQPNYYNFESYSTPGDEFYLFDLLNSNGYA